jgi:N,N'-diacetylchitobiose transport system permease protein
LSSTVPVAPTPVAPAAPLRGRPRRPGRRRLANRILLNLTALLVFAVMVFPVYWMVATAFKPGIDIQRYSPKWFPSPATLVHFKDAIELPFFWDCVKNSLIIVSVVVGLSLALGFLAALALAKFRFYGRKAFIVLIIAVQMVPLNALIIPLYIVLARAGRVNTLTGVIVVYLTFVLPFTVWTLRGFLLGIPPELEEAAMVDGSSRLGAFFRILLPLVAPGLVATSIFAFIQAWNEFLVAYVLLSSQEKQTLTVWLAAFTGGARGTDWGALMAGSTLTAIPVIVFFLLVQRRIAFGLTAGAVKA